MHVNANMKIAAAIRRVLDRHGDVLEAYPEFVREHLLARLDVGASSEVSEYAERLSSSTLARGGLVTSAGRFQRDEACLKVLVRHKPGLRCGAAGSGSPLVVFDRTLRLWHLDSANAFVCSRDIPVRSVTSRRCPTGAPSRRQTTAPCGFGTSPRGNACASWRAIPIGSVMSRRCPTGAPSRRQTTGP